jgi:hypothetical protein
VSDPSPDLPRREFARATLDSIKWPFERCVWALQRRLIWPIQDRLRRPKRARGPQRGRRTFRPGEGVVATALISAVTLSGAGAAMLSLPEVEPTAAAEGPAAAPAVAAAAVSTETIRTDVASLRGKAPSFQSDRKNPRRPARAAEAGSTAAPVAPPTPAIDPTGAPKAALTTAQRFARAFVNYEVGNSNARVEKAFRETASAPLVKALAQRPPRLPAKGEVPKAKVLNVVPGQRLGRTLSVSVALVRLGATSELRLQLDKTKSGWLISDVRG